MAFDQSDHPFGSDPDLIPAQEAPDVSEEMALMLNRAADLQRMVDAAKAEIDDILKPAIAANLLYMQLSSLTYGDREFVYVGPHNHSSFNSEAGKDFLIELGASPADIRERCYKNTPRLGSVTIRKITKKKG